VTSTPTKGIFADRWYRFDRYQILDGYIRPAPNAELIPYEPWKDFRTLVGKEGIKQPYESLVHLVRKVEGDRSNARSIRLQGASEDCLLEWCSQHGLLGLLLSRIETADLHTEDRAAPPELKVDGSVRQSTRFVRTNRGWSHFTLLPLHDVKPGVYLRSKLSDFEITFESLSSSWGPYFPDVPVDKRDEYQYPMPFTAEFWMQYCEPIGEFLSAAKMLCEAVETLRKLASRRSPSEFDRRAELQAMTVMHALASPLRPYFIRPRRDMAWGGIVTHLLPFSP
jgi:hypothetical protein